MKTPLSNYLIYGGFVTVSAPLLAQTSAPNQLPNILFIVADDLGYNDLGVMGSDFYETPHIDALVAEGTLFTNAYAAAANSAPSRASYLTGLYTPRHGVYTVNPPERGNSELRALIPSPNRADLTRALPTIAELLSTRGYDCIHLGKWHLGSDLDASKTGPLSRGFSQNIGGDRQGHPYSYFYPYCRDTLCHVGLQAGEEGEYLTTRLTEEAKHFLQQHDPSKPFFMHFAHYTVHTPLQAPQQLVEKYQRKKPGKHHSNVTYAAMVETLDQSVGELLAELKRLKLDQNTVVVFYSDNGGSEPVTSNFSLRAGKGSLYEGGIKVPLIVQLPNGRGAGKTVETAVTGVDFLPTFMELAQIPSDSYQTDGRSLLPAISQEKSPKRYLFWHFPAYLESYFLPQDGFRATPASVIRDNEWKLIYYFESQTAELYHLTIDPKESINLIDREQAKAQELMTALQTWWSETEAPHRFSKNPAFRAR